MSAHATIQPELVEGAWRCTDRCPSYDGKRCELLGHQPEGLCVPACRADRAVTKAARSMIGGGTEVELREALAIGLLTELGRKLNEAP